MEDCIFCKIIKGEIPSNKVYEDEDVLAFHDISPQAPVHFLVIPKKHIKSALEIKKEDGALLSKVFGVIGKIADELHIAKDGFRVISNIGKNGQQSVDHLHFHVLGGRMMSWPPG
jgi:histidine triad (HIT) family protein